MTLDAQSAIQASDIVVGYTLYVELLRSIFPEKNYLSTGMKSEAERVNLALSEAQNGKTVALICSGDSGVYGMAGLALELSENYTNIDIEIVPGVTAALAYEDGDVHRPFVIGSLWAKKNTPPASVSDGKNEIFKLITPNKSYVEFSDAPKKEHITVSTPKGHRIDLDDENDVISVTDGKNKVDISGKSGSVELTCEKKLTIKVGSGVTITCDGNSGAVEIKTNSKIELNSAKIGVKASGEASVEGSGSVTVKSSGVMTIKGSMTKIN